jgi:hypothetical protein
MPLITPFDNIGYFPVYNMAEKLRFRFTLNSAALCVHCITDARAPSFAINDVVWLLDGMVVRSGGSLTQDQFRWPFHNIWSSVTQRAIGQNKFKVSFDVKKTSLKNYLGWFSQDLVPFRALEQWGNGNCAYSLQTTSFWFSMGGYYYPLRQPLVQEYELYLQFLKYFHRFDSTTMGSDIYVDYTTGYEGVLAANCGTYHFYCCVFDKLDQVSSIISGIDSERYDTMLEITCAPDVNHDLAFSLYSFFHYDCVITLIGGELKVED